MKIKTPTIEYITTPSDNTYPMGCGEQQQARPTTLRDYYNQEFTQLWGDVGDDETHHAVKKSAVRGAIRYGAVSADSSSVWSSSRRRRGAACTEKPPSAELCRRLCRLHQYNPLDKLRISQQNYRNGMRWHC